MTADLSCLKNVRLVLETMDSLGYERGKIQLVLNRSNAYTGINVDNAESALGPQDRLPGHQRVPRRDQRPELGRAVHVVAARTARSAQSVAQFAQEIDGVLAAEAVAAR